MEDRADVAGIALTGPLGADQIDQQNSHDAILIAQGTRV